MEGLPFEGFSFPWPSTSPPPPPPQAHFEEGKQGVTRRELSWQVARSCVGPAPQSKGGADFMPPPQAVLAQGAEGSGFHKPGLRFGFARSA